MLIKTHKFIKFNIKDFNPNSSLPLIRKTY